MTLPRHSRLGVLAAAALTLVLAASFAVYSLSQLRAAQVENVSSRIEINKIKAQLPAIQQREAYGKEAKLLQTQVVSAGLSPTLWANRKVQQPVAVFTRQSAEKLFTQQLGFGDRQWFAADRFDVSVIDQSAGLFTPANAQDKGFSVEMVGILYFPLQTK